MRMVANMKRAEAEYARTTPPLVLVGPVSGTVTDIAVVQLGFHVIGYTSFHADRIHSFHILGCRSVNKTIC